MKSVQPQSVIKISQSEAMLEAIHAGFFEAYLEKSILTELLPKNTCPGIRIELVESSQENLSFRICAIGKTEARTKLVRCTMATISTRPYAVEFQSGDLYTLLSQPECIGIRFFPGRTKQARPTLVAVGVESNGFDIDHGAGYLLSLRNTTISIA